MVIVPVAAANGAIGPKDSPRASGKAKGTDLTTPREQAYAVPCTAIAAQSTCNKA